MPALNPALVLAAYQQGLFPMGDSRDSHSVSWYSARERGIIPLDVFHVPRRLQKTLRSQKFSLSFNRAFADVIAACAAPRTLGRAPQADSWINPPIIKAYTALHQQGFAHSIEVWQGETPKKTLVGGLYGVALGRAFFAESMFSHVRDASKVALAHMLLHLRAHGFLLFDTQFVTPHLLQFGAQAISADDYSARLSVAIAAPAPAGVFAPAATGCGTFNLQSTTQIS